MTTPAQGPPAYGSIVPPKPRPHRKWLLGAGAVVLLLLLWKCGTALYEGRGQANAFVADFHQKLNAARYDEIFQAADQGFRTSGKEDELVKFLAAVHNKLGNANSATLINLQVNATTRGNFLTAQYNTSFDHGAAVETFTCIRANGIVKLYGYNVQSNALVVQ